jgi:hypothetical protein
VALMPLLFLSIFFSIFADILEHLECNVFTLALFIVAKPRHFFSHLFESHERAQSTPQMPRARMYQAKISVGDEREGHCAFSATVQSCWLGPYVILLEGMMNMALVNSSQGQAADSGVSLFLSCSVCFSGSVCFQYYYY